MKKLILAFLLLTTTVVFGREAFFSITPITDLPPEVTTGQILTLQYKVANQSIGNLYYNLIGIDADQGLSIGNGTTCASKGLFENMSDCTLILKFDTSKLPLGAYSNAIGLNYGAAFVPSYTLKTTIVSNNQVTAFATVSGVSADANNQIQVVITNAEKSASIKLSTGKNNLGAFLPGVYTVTATDYTDRDLNIYEPTIVEGNSVNFNQNPTNITINYSLVGPNVLMPVTATISGLPNGAPVNMVLNNTQSGQPSYGPVSLAVNGTPQSFGQVNVGTYYAGPTTLTVGGTTYNLDSTGPFNIHSGSTNVSLHYTPVVTPPANINSTITITGNLTSVASQSLPITLTNTNTSASYGPITILANGQAQTFATIPVGTYSITPLSYMIGNNQYNLKSIGPFSISDSQPNISLEYNLKIAPVGGYYDWHQNHFTTLQDANVFAVLWGGGSTTGNVRISTNPPINPWLNAQVETYENSPISLNAHSTVQGMPNYIAMGTVTEVDQTPGVAGSVTQQLESQHLDLSFHYEGNGAGNRGCFFDDSTCGYTPEVANMAKEAATVTAANGHKLMAAEVFYTIDFSDGAWAIGQDTEVDANVIPHLYNLMIEAQLMQQQYLEGNQMVLFLNPDSVWSFQNCGINYCSASWKKGLTTDPTATQLIANPNLITDFNAALDRMVEKGYLSQTLANQYKAEINTVIPLPSTNLRDTYGLPEMVQMNNWIVKTFAPNVPFGWGLNAYDNANPLMNPEQQDALWETSSVTWIHKVNHLAGINVDQSIQMESIKLAQYIKEMNFVGNAQGDYKPDFIYFDIYERDPIPGQVTPGFLFNGVDWDTYLAYIKYTDQAIDNLPVALWQMPGASLQTTGNTFTGNLAGTVPDWIFGDPNLQNDFSNSATALGLLNISFTENMTNNVYYTSGLDVNNVVNYLELNHQ